MSQKPNNPKLFAVKITQNNQSGYFSNNSKPTQESYLLSKINHVSIHALMHLLYRMSNILTKRKKPNIIRIYDTITRNSKIFLFQDLICGGDLFSYLVKDDYLKAIPEREAILLFSK